MSGTKPPDVTRNKWLPGLLAHVYGQEAAEKILQEEARQQALQTNKYHAF